MFQPYYIKSIYLKRVIFSGVLIAIFSIGVWLSLSENPAGRTELSQSTWTGLCIMLACIVVSALRYARFFAAWFEEILGFRLFYSWLMMALLYQITAMLSLFFIPPYFVFNLIQYFRASPI